MRYSDERKLAQDLKNRLFKPVYLITGDEPFLKTAYRSRLVDAALDGEASGFNLIVLPGGKLDMGDLLGAVTTLPLLSGRRCVVVDEFVPDKVGADELKQWPEVLANIPRETLLLLVQQALPDPDKKRAAEKFFTLVDTAGGAVVTLGTRKGNDLIAFVVRRCEEGGAAVDPATARYLTLRVGEDMARLGTECDKLSAHAGPGTRITEAMIDALTPAAVEADVYRLSRHIFAGELDRALHLVDALCYLKTPIPLIVATLSGAFADLYRARVGYDKGYTQDKIVKDFGYRHAFRVKNALRDARPLRKAQIESAMSALLEADLLMKTTQQDDRHLLEQAVVRAAAALQGEDLP